MQSPDLVIPITIHYEDAELHIPISLGGSKGPGVKIPVGEILKGVKDSARREDKAQA
jgi:hypothetical protein